MATTIHSSSLDFTAIKNNLKTYLQQQSEFKDYDFEAAGLSNILDVLAYNTHMNGLTANFALNESFLNTAQLRSSVVSHAETLGYVPASKSAAQATVNLSFNIGIDQEDVPEKLQVSSGYKFTSSVNDASYTFQTQELIEATNDGNNFFQFQTLEGSTEIPVFEGIAKTKTFFAGEDTEGTLYIIPDINMDRSTAVVKVYESATSGDFTSYINLEVATNIDVTTPAYILKEAPNGYYELSFGNGSTLGAVPTAGSKVTIEYLSVDGSNANGARLFEPVNTIEVTEPTSGIGLERLPVVSTTNRSVGGSAKESLASIRKNSPYRYATQNRMVTHADYASLVLRTYGSLIDDIIAWGGEDNLVPEYGMAFLSIKFKSDVTDSLKETTKDNIRVLVDQLSIASFGLKYTDPVVTFIENNVFFQYNPDYTNLSINALQESVRNVMTSYYTTNTGKFGQAFRRSQLLALIDDVSPAILSSRADVSMQQRFTPSGGVEGNFSFDFPTQISNPLIDQKVITSSVFKKTTAKGLLNCQIVNKETKNIVTIDTLTSNVVVVGKVNTVTTAALGENNITTTSSSTQEVQQGLVLQIIDTGTGDVVIDNVGYYIPGAGIVHLVGFKADESTEIKMSVIPANQSAIVPNREYILEYDNTRLSAKGLRTTASN